MFSSPGSIAMRIGSFEIHWYGILIGLGILFAYLYILKEAHRRDLKPENFDNLAIVVILGGVIGARLYYVLFNLSYYLSSPLEILKLWNGGLAIHGALLGGLIAFFIYTQRKNLPRLLYLDVMLPGVLIAQAVGRWGNFFNSEAFGTPTDLPWKLFIDERFRPSQYAAFSYFHPTFLYEFIWNLVGFLLLAYLGSALYPSASVRPGVRHLPYGAIACAYLVWYSFGRFFIESLRTDSLYIGPLKVAQVVSVVLFFLGLFGLFFLQKKNKVNSAA